jgi:hypothetical protein
MARSDTCAARRATVIVRPHAASWKHMTSADRLPDVGEQVEVVFDWNRDLHFAGTVESATSTEIVVQVPSGAPTGDTRLHVYEWAWSQPGQMLALDFVNWEP